MRQFFSHTAGDLIDFVQIMNRIVNAHRVNRLAR